MPLRHHTLVAWQRADDLFIELHQLTLKSFPTHEKFELGRQTRRAAFSIAVNIVEGCVRNQLGAALSGFINAVRDGRAV
ncbi:MAG TPA: four helix bundle protein [Vicinamibacterales bacterium]|jgi:four helix bundle protein